MLVAEWTAKTQLSSMSDLGAPLASTLVANEAERQCFICLDTEEKEPVIAPCQCLGSRVHRSCLDEWRRNTADPRYFTHCRQCSTKFEFELVRVPRQRQANRISLCWRVVATSLACFRGTLFSLMSLGSLTALIRFLDKQRAVLKFFGCISLQQEWASYSLAAVLLTLLFLFATCMCGSPSCAYEALNVARHFENLSRVRCVEYWCCCLCVAAYDLVSFCVALPFRILLFPVVWLLEVHWKHRQLLQLTDTWVVKDLSGKHPVSIAVAMPPGAAPDAATPEDLPAGRGPRSHPRLTMMAMPADVAPSSADAEDTAARRQLMRNMQAIYGLSEDALAERLRTPFSNAAAPPGGGGTRASRGWSTW